MSSQEARQLPDDGSPIAQDAQGSAAQDARNAQPGDREYYERTIENDAKQLDALRERNHALAAALTKAGKELQDAKSRLNDLAHPPITYAVFVRVDEMRIDRGAQRATAEVLLGSRRQIVAVSPQVKADRLRPGQEVLLNENLVLVRACGSPLTGTVCQIKAIMGPSRLMVEDSSGSKSVVLRAASLGDGAVREGDDVLVDPSGRYAVEAMPREDINDLVLEEAPDVTFADIGGLDSQIERIRDAVESPFLHRDLYERYGLKPPQGVLLYGPPGNGKTLIAKAIANAISNGFGAGRGVFLSVKGPEILSKYVGEAERIMRSVFARARDRAASGVPVVVFIDEMDSLLRTRGSGVSSDIETTVVPQFLSELDGVETLDNVIVIGASNRIDMIDPAVLRPGRLDVKIRIDRPGRSEAADILSRYITPDLPIDPTETRESLIDAVVDDVYEESHRRHICALYNHDGVRRDIYLAQLTSGAMLSSIVNRAKMSALKQTIASGAPTVITRAALLAAVQQEFLESADAASQAYTSQNVQQWARLAGIGDNVAEVMLSGYDDIPHGGASFTEDGGIK